MKFETPEQSQQSEAEIELEELSNVIESLGGKLSSYLEDRKKTKEEAPGVGGRNRRRARYKNSKNELYQIRDEMVLAYPGWSEVITAITESFRPSTEWAALMTHLLDTYKDRPDLLKKFWGFLWSNNVIGIENRLGVMAHAGAYQLLQGLGFDVRTATPEEDARREADLYIGNIPVQVKSMTSLRNKKEDHNPPIIISRNRKNSPLEVSINVRYLDRYTARPNHALAEKARIEIERKNILKNNRS